MKKNNPFATQHALSQLKLFTLRQLFKILNNISLYLASHLALRIFLTPPRSPIPQWQKSCVASAVRSTMKINQKTIHLYEWGSGDLIILLVHGWGGRGTQFAAFIEPFIQAGYRVIAFDGPAQGDSTGKTSNMFEFATLIEQIVKDKGPLYALMGHSFGAACSLLALHQYSIPIKKLILIGCPASSIWITEDFAQRLAISKKTIERMRALIQMRYGDNWRWDKLLSQKYLFKKVNVPTLIIHDQNDKEVPYSHAIELKSVGYSCQLLTTQSQGHRRILRNLAVVNTVIKFLK